MDLDVPDATCAQVDAAGRNGELNPEVCAFVSHFDVECFCPNVDDRGNQHVFCDLCGTRNLVNNR
jgi:hypothetical protein